jgi:hypothetical protein
MHVLRALFFSVVFLYTISVVAGINFGSKQSVIKFADATKLFVKNNMSINSGCIQQSTGALFKGNTIGFDNSFLGIDSTCNCFTGKYDGASSYKIILDGDKSFYAQQNITTPPITVSGTGNKLKGNVYFDQSDAISFVDSDSELTLAMQGAINQNIVLNGGTINLSGDLGLNTNVVFTGGGIVNGYDYTVFLGNTTNWNDNPFSFTELSMEWPSGTVHWKNSTVLQLQGNVTLLGQWNFYDTCTIIGNGYSLDIADGKLCIMENSTLTLVDVKLKGIIGQPEHNANIEFGNEASQIKLQHGELQLDSSWTLTTGGIYVETSSTVIAPTRTMLTLDLGSSLTVDGCVLWYESLSPFNYQNIQPSYIENNNITRLTLLNKGIIKASKGESNGDLINYATRKPQNIFLPKSAFDHDFLTRSNWWDNLTGAPTYDISNFIDVSTSNSITFSESSLVDGAYNTIDFIQPNNPNNPLITVDSGVSIAFNNVWFNNFKFSYLSPSSSSNVLFGPGFGMTLAEGEYELNTTYTINGDCTIDGNGAKITLGPHGGLEVAADSMLWMYNITFLNVSGKKIRCLDETSYILLENNVNMYLDDHFFFDNGHMTLDEGSACILDIHGTHSFVLSSNGHISITSDAILQISDGAIFSYEPKTDNRDLLWCADETSILKLNNGTLASTTTGMRLTHGTLQIQGENNYIENPGATSLSEGIMLGSGQLIWDMYFDPYFGWTPRLVADVASNMGMEFYDGTLTIKSGLFVWANVEDLT